MQNKTILENEDDFVLIDQVLEGKVLSLEKLIQKYQSYVFNVSLRMLGNFEDARDATQEILIKVITNLKGFRKKSSFKTWLFRIMMNYLLDAQKTRSEKQLVSFGQYSEIIQNSKDATLKASETEAKILYEETRNHCLMGMILCLDRKHRFVFILGEILGFDGFEGAEIVGISPENFRKMLSRARKKIYSFMKNNCGLVDPKNLCRCELKAHILFKPSSADSIQQSREGTFGELRDKCSNKTVDLDRWFEETSGKLFSLQPIYKSPDFFLQVRKIIDQEKLETILQM
ncbi:RNA polymerase sigma factor [candidate division WOR-3 bacterium]|nr:RNA polymerase sigma factor [candidate division WOR-3 bacterium]